jgi:hypothetical protein
MLISNEDIEQLEFGIEKVNMNNIEEKVSKKDNRTRTETQAPTPTQT